MDKWLRQILITLTCLIILANTLVRAEVNTSAHEPLLVVDRPIEPAVEIKKLRLNKELKASASGQFTASELSKLFTVIPALKKHIWIIDLRQESHGFVNGLPVTWYTEQNEINLNKTATQILAAERELLNNLSKQQKITVYHLNKLVAGKISAGESITLIPEDVASEQQLVTNAHGKYQRLYVLDHHRPDDVTVDNFIDFVRTKVTAEDWLHFHCRGGKGRSSTFMAMYDMLKNSCHTSFMEIIQRQARHGNIALDKIPTEQAKHWKAGFAQERYEFLQKFYHYASDPNGYGMRNWSAWLELRK